MDYQGPTPDDLVNVAALNRLFIRSQPGLLGNGSGAGQAPRLTDLERSRLAATPFLLFSLREQDRDYWQSLIGDTPQFDLLDRSEPADAATAELQAAGLGFLWQLARRNPYAARLVSGAPVSWCETIASLTLVRLLQRAATQGDLLRVRLAAQDPLWRRLIVNGKSAREPLRLASHHSALQAILMRDREHPGGRIAVAARAMPAPLQTKTRSALPGQETTKL